MYNVWAVGPVGMTGVSQNCHSSRKNLNLCVFVKNKRFSPTLLVLYMRMQIDEIVLVCYTPVINAATCVFPIWTEIKTVTFRENAYFEYYQYDPWLSFTSSLSKYVQWLQILLVKMFCVYEAHHTLVLIAIWIQILLVRSLPRPMEIKPTRKSFSEGMKRLDSSAYNTNYDRFTTFVLSTKKSCVSDGLEIMIYQAGVRNVRLYARSLIIQQNPDTA